MSYIEVHTTACHAGMDGECYWSECPQAVNYQPHCPLDRVAVEPWASSQYSERVAEYLSQPGQADRDNEFRGQGGQR